VNVVVTFDFQNLTSSIKIPILCMTSIYVFSSKLLTMAHFYFVESWL